MWIAGYHLASVPGADDLTPGAHKTTVHVTRNLKPVEMLFVPNTPPGRTAIHSGDGYDISGVVIDESGRPIQEASVRVMKCTRDYDFVHDDIASDIFTKVSITDDQGRFVIKNAGHKAIIDDVARNARFTLAAVARGYRADFAENVDPVAGPVEFKLTALKPAEAAAPGRVVDHPRTE
jgi:hypothetical protein